MKYRDALLLPVGDLHAGGSTALFPRGQVQLLSGGYHTASYLQGLIRAQWEEFTDAVKAARHHRRLIVVMNGDLIDGDHHGTVEIVTPVLMDQRDIACTLIDEMLQWIGFNSKQGDTIRFTNGTPAHAGKIWAEEEAIAEDFGAIPFIPAGTDTKARYLHPEVKLNINGSKHTIRHYGPSVGRAEHTKENSLYRFLKNEYFRSLKGFVPSDYYTFGHRHRYNEATFSKPSEGVALNARVLPSWQSRTEYSQVLEDHDEIGGLYYLIDADGTVRQNLLRMEYEPVSYEVA